MSFIQHLTSSPTSSSTVNQKEKTIASSPVEKDTAESEVQEDNMEIVPSNTPGGMVKADAHCVAQDYCDVTPTSTHDHTLTKTDYTCPFPLSVEDVRTPTHFTYYTERYFSQFLVRNCKGVDGNNVRLLLHSNMLVVLCLDVTHTVVRDQLEISYLGHSPRIAAEKAQNQNISDRSGKNQQNKQSSMKVQGKKKKNATLCQKEMTLCFIETKCGKKFKVPASVDGMLLELNTHIISNPILIQRFPLQEGYIAIINPLNKVKFEDFEMVSASVCGGMGKMAVEIDVDEEPF